MLYNALGQNIFTPIIRYTSKTNPQGSKIVLTCLNHGDEVVSLNAAYEVIEYVKKHDSDFAGEIVIFSCLNYEGFINSARYFVAQKFDDSAATPNLNRKYPGGDNDFVERYAKQVFDQILAEKPDYVFDLHSYAHNSIVHAILDRPGGELETKLLDLCRRSRVPFYLEFEAETYQVQQLDHSLSNQLCLQNIPALTIELGPIKGFNLDQSKLATMSVLNFLSATGNLAVYQMQDLYALQQTELDPNKNYFRQPIYNQSDYSGFYRPLVRVGKLIKKDTEIAEIIDLNMELKSVIKMPKDGYLIAFDDIAFVYPYRQIGVFISQD
jgi:predicted deacylase